MKIAIIGSRTIEDIDLSCFLDIDNISEIVSGGAKGVDTLAKTFAKKFNIHLVEFFPDYKRFKRAAPIVRNKEIVNYADKVLAFWNGQSKGTKSTIDFARKKGKPIEIIIRSGV